MTPDEFASKWKGSTLTERSASQSHFSDLCRVLGWPTPTDDDPTGERFAFEKGAEKLGGGEGFADVWRKDCFAWEYKGKRKDLAAAYQQLNQYREALDNPPLLIVSDMERFEIHGPAAHDGGRRGACEPISWATMGSWRPTDTPDQPALGGGVPSALTGPTARAARRGSGRR